MLRSGLLMLGTFGLASTMACGSADLSRNDPLGGGGPGAAGGAGGTAGSTGTPGGSGGSSFGGGTSDDAAHAEEEVAADPDNKSTSQSAPTNAACNGKSQVERGIATSLPDSNAFASPGLAADTLSSGGSPLPVWVRTGDFLNQYAIDLDETNASPSALGNGAPKLPVMQLQMQPSTEPSSFDLLVAVETPPAANDPKRWVSVVLDTTPSMTGEGLARGKAAIAAIANLMQATDTLLVHTTDGVELAYDPTAGPTQVLDQLATVGIGAEVEPIMALQGAYDALQDAPSDAVRRIVFVSDGNGEPATLSSVPLSQAASAGDFFVGIATGPAERHQDRFFRAATAEGRGHYLYITSSETAQSVIAKRFSSMFAPAYQDVQLQITIPWFFDLIANPTETTVTLGVARPQDLGPGDRASFLFRLRACDYTLAYDKLASNVTAELRWVTSAGPDATKQTVATYDLLNPPQPARNVAKAVAVFEFAEALKSLDGRRLDEAYKRAQAANKLFGNAESDLQTIINQLPLHPAWSGPSN